MAIAPKGARKRTIKKKSAKADSQTTEATTTSEEVSDVAEQAAEKKSGKRAPSIPVPMFQAAPEEVAPKKVSAKKPVAQEAEAESTETSEEGAERRRRRRGGRGRRRGARDSDGNENSTDRDSDTDEALDAGAINDDESEESSTSSTPRRRRRRRASGDGVTPGEIVDEDGVVTVVKVREPREARPARESRSRDDQPSRSRDRGRNRNDRSSRRDREPRDFVRRRGTIITESEFLARRENVDRQMLVRQAGDRTQIAVLEDNIMVEHYVNRNSNISYVGNVYLGKVQNVLPSMEAAFVDIGKGRNAVLYAGEVNWDAAGLTDGAPRKIEHVLKTGQSVLVQVTKDPIGQKGARLTSQISLPGRYIVYVPSGEMSGISRRLPEQERSRLKSILKDLIPEDAGVIVRTSSEGASSEEIEHDVARLKAQWEDIESKAATPGTAAPSLLYAEPDLTVRVIRDIFNEDFKKLIVQGDQAWEDINLYLSHIAPELTTKIEKWTGTRDLFVENRIEEQLAKAFDRKVYLPSGGSLVIDRTEAMIVIDVNTGKFIGKGGNLEETVTKNNLEAAEEIARQLRLRDMGGIIVIDFIDMTLESNRDQVLRRLVECLGRDRTKHQVAEVTSLGLVQMTRKRVGQGLIEAFSTTCESCGGRGIHIHSEPVQKVALDKDMDKRYVPSSQLNDEAEVVELDDESQGPNQAPQNEEGSDSSPVAEDSNKKPQKRRRRAVSTGVITPN
ncbi:MAG: Rne/Rng family ribonuclease [Actinobacteria bacterium]|jgi:ribonuclease E|nr:Rne/Rng family ribonuclease [Actinomycetota bacterium]